MASRAQTLLQRHPLAVDTVIAGALAVAALVSLAATYGALPANDPTYSHGFTVAVVASMLAITLPLAGRRRFPFSAGAVVVAGFLVARAVVHVPEANITLLALWLMFYSVAVYGNRRRRTPFLAAVLPRHPYGTRTELFFPGPSRRIAPGSKFRPLVQRGSPLPALDAWCSDLVVAGSSANSRRSGCSNFRENVRRTPVGLCSKNAFGSLVSCTMSWRTM